MRIDSTQRLWFVASLVILAGTTLAYVSYALSSPRGPRGGSPMGLAFGFAGFGFMIYAGLLGARKKVPVWRLGRAQTWMRGHLWLGLLSLPLIFFHGGFRFGGPLTTVLMWLLILTVLSGVFGAVLQHYVPRVMMERVPLETIYDEIGQIRIQLREEAEGYVETLCGSLPLVAESVAGESQRAGGFTALRPPRGGTPEAPAELTEADTEPVRGFYATELRPFLENPEAKWSRLADEGRSHAAFAKLRMLVPSAVHPTIENLEDLCSEERQLSRQMQLHRVLHGWLLFHVPLSLLLLALSVFHAVVALRY
jgi:hypothetical protein